MFFNEIKLNTTIDIEPVVIDKQKMLDFARFYDNIPIHTDEEYASNTHFGKIIAPGIMSFMSVWANYLKVDIFGNEFIAGKSINIQWHKPVYAEDILTGKAIVSDVVDRNEKNGLVEITVYSSNNLGASASAQT